MKEYTVEEFLAIHRDHKLLQAQAKSGCPCHNCQHKRISAFKEYEVRYR